MLSIDLFLAHLSGFLRDLNIGTHWQAFIMERSGDLVASSKGQVLMVDQDPSLSRRLHGMESESPVVQEAVKTMVGRFGGLAPIQGKHYLDFEVQGRKHLLQVSSLKFEPGIDWLVVVSMPEDDFMAGITARNRTTILLTLGLVGVTLLIVSFMARRIARPISLLERAADRLTPGSPPEEIAEKSWFVEVRNLTRSFNQMSRKLTGSIQMLNAELSERRQAEEKLHLQSLLLNQIQDRVTMTDVNGVITYVNDAEARGLGCSRDELIGATTEKYGEDPEQGATQREIIEKTLKHGRWRGEVVNKTVEGKEVILDCRTQVVFDEQGNTAALARIATDITECKRTEEALKRRELTLNKIFEVLPIGLWFADKNGKLIKGNPVGVELWGAELTVPMEEYGVFKARRLPDREEIGPNDWALAHTIKNGTTITDELLEIDAFDGRKKMIPLIQIDPVKLKSNITGPMAARSGIP